MGIPLGEGGVLAIREEKDDENRGPALLCPAHLPLPLDRLPATVYETWSANQSGGLAAQNMLQN